MMKRKQLIMLLPIAVGCLCACPGPDQDELPIGPCNNDGETGARGEVGFDEEGGGPEEDDPSLGLYPPVMCEFPGWTFDADLGGLYRRASEEERRRNDWREPTTLLALPLSPADRISGGRVEISVPVPSHAPTWASGPGEHMRIFDLEFHEQQQLTLGNFVEHRATPVGATHEVTNPIFTYFATMSGASSAGELLVSTSGQFLARAHVGRTPVVVSGPHPSADLDIVAPGSYVVVRVATVSDSLTGRPLEAYSCENGDCDDPHDPLDECNDGLDNDGDGVRDGCDWNCLPHVDFGAENFPLATSRVEAGKSYALLGHGSFCTLNPDTWEIVMADTALKAAELLNGLRPDLERPVRYRSFSCWVFESYDDYLLCETGPFEVVDGLAVYDSPVCPPGMDDYPYKPTQNDQLSAADQSKTTFGEALTRVWQDLEYSAEILGPIAEPMHGAMSLTSDLKMTCYASEWPDDCPSASGRSVLPHGDIERRGTGVVSDEPSNADMWGTLAHETAHTIGLVHDDFPFGFMSEDGGNVAGLGVSTDPDWPNLDNNSRWETGLTSSKGIDPRSSGFYFTGCTELADCAPLGKPGWSCTGLFCIED